MNQGMKQFAPETAIGTGAKFPLADEYEAAVATPSVDEATVQPEAANQPGHETIEYSGETFLEANEKLETDGGSTDTEKSTGEDFETRQAAKDDEPGGDAVGSVLDDAEVNSEASEVRPEVPQATKATRKKRDTV